MQRERHLLFFFFKQKTAYEIGTGDWSSDVCSSDLVSCVTTTNITGGQLQGLLKWSLVYFIYAWICKFGDVREQLRSEERRVGKSVDLGGRRIIKKKTKLSAT